MRRLQSYWYHNKTKCQQLYTPVHIILPPTGFIQWMINPTRLNLRVSPPLIHSWLFITCTDIKCTLTSRRYQWFRLPISWNHIKRPTARHPAREENDWIEKRGEGMSDLMHYSLYMKRESVVWLGPHSYNHSRAVSVYNQHGWHKFFFFIRGGGGGGRRVVHRWWLYWNKFEREKKKLLWWCKGGLISLYRQPCKE